MNNECPVSSGFLKNYLFYNQIRVNVAVAIVLIRKAKRENVNRTALIAQIQSNFIKYWSETQPNDGFRNKIISNLQEKCIKGVLDVLPNNYDNFKDPKVNDLMCLVGKSVGIHFTISQKSDSDIEDENETARNCEFLRLVVGLKDIVDSKTFIDFNKSAFKFVSDCDDSGVDCDKTSSTLNFTNVYSASVLSLPSIKFKSITHSSDTDAALKVTLQKLLETLKITILKYARKSYEKWKDSNTEMSVATVKSLAKNELHLDTITEFLSKILKSLWKSFSSPELIDLQYQTFIFSKLLCHENICSRLVEDLVQYLPSWCSSIVKITNNIDSQEFYSFILNGPLILDLVSVILKRWYYYLKHQISIKEKSTGVTSSTNIKDLWKSKWDIDEKTEKHYNATRYIHCIDSLRFRFIKFLKKVAVDFPLLSPQIYIIIDILDKCKTAINENIEIQK